MVGSVPVMPDPITDQWLRDTGFRYDEPFKPGQRHWTLWLGGAASDRAGYEDLGVELMQHVNPDDGWFCWIRADYSHRYSRFIHVRDMHTTDEVIRLIEGLVGQAFDRQNVYYGMLLSPNEAERRRQRDETDLHRRLAIEWGKRVEQETGADTAKRELLRP